MIVCGIVHPVALIGIVALAALHAPGSAMLALGVIAGLMWPPVSMAMRAQWGLAVEEPDRIVAYGLVYLVQQLAVLGGPLLLSVGIRLSNASWAMVLVATVSGVGTLAYALMVWRAPLAPMYVSAADAARLRWSGEIASVVLIAFLASAVLGAIEVGVPTVATAHHAPAASGLIIAGLSIGGIAGALLYGARRWASAPSVRLVLLLGAMTVALAVIVPLRSLLAIGVVLALAGLAFNPILTTVTLLIDGLVPAASVTEAFGWLSTGVAGGQGASQAFTALVTRPSHPQTAFVLATLVSASATGLAVLAGRRYRAIAPRRVLSTGLRQNVQSGSPSLTGPALNGSGSFIQNGTRPVRELMAATETGVQWDIAGLQEQAREHLWMHFTRMSAYADQEIPIIVRGEGCYVYDAHGNRYLDGLSSLFCTNIGHGRVDIAQAGADQAKELGFFNTWSYANPPAITLAAKVASLAPGDLNRVFFTSGGSESVESALKLARQYFKHVGKPTKHKLIAREVAYHGTSFGALSATGITSIKTPFEPITPGGCHVPNTNVYRLPDGMTVDGLAEVVARRIEFEGPDTVAAVIMEPVQNAGGCFTPPDGYFQRIREICDEYDVLMISDEVICSWGRLGEWFGAQRFGYQPDIITTAKGITSAYAPMGAVIFSDRIAAPFLEGDRMFSHGFTFGGHPMCAAVALANIDAFEREGVLEHVRANAPAFRAMLDSLLELPIVGDVRGDGYFVALELVKDKATKQTFNDEESETLLRGFLSTELYRRGLFCRADDRGDPVVILAPPLIAGPEHFAEIEAVLRPVLTEAGERMRLPGH